MAEPSPSVTIPATPANTPSSSTTDNPSGGPKTLFLIRHAQSLENQRIGSFLSCLGDIGRFSLPKRSDVGSAVELLNLPANHDAPLSEAGLKQCDIMKTKLQQHDFVATHKVQLVAHSPLIRAKQTCQELLGCSSDFVMDEDNTKTNEEEEVKFQSSTTSNGSAAPTTSVSSTASNNPISSNYPPPIQRVVSMNMLLEKTQMEWVPGNFASFERRTIDFTNWLSQQPESVIAVVGHSQFFKYMLDMPFKFNNVDVYQVSFDASKTTTNETVIMEHNGTADEVKLRPQWYDLKLLHTCHNDNGEGGLPPTTKPNGETQESSSNNGGDNLL